MPPSRDSRHRRVPPIPPRPSHNTYPTLAMCSTGSTSCAGSPKASPTYDARYNTATPELRPPTFEPDLLASPLHPPTPSRPPHRSPPSTPQQAVRRSSPPPNRVRMLYQLYEADNPDRANQALGRFADLYATGQTPRIPRSRGHHHRMGRTDLGVPHHKAGIQRTPRRNQQPPPESYAASPTGSPTPTITQPEESS